MLNRVFNVVFGKKERGRLIVNSEYSKSGNKICINVEEFDPLSIVMISCFGPFDKEPFRKNSYYVNDNGSISNGEIEIEITKTFPTGTYRIVAEGIASKTEKRISKNFELE